MSLVSLPLAVKQEDGGHGLAALPGECEPDDFVRALTDDGDGDLGEESWAGRIRSPTPTNPLHAGHVGSSETGSSWDSRARR